MIKEEIIQVPTKVYSVYCDNCKLPIVTRLATKEEAEEYGTSMAFEVTDNNAEKMVMKTKNKVLCNKCYKEQYDKIMNKLSAIGFTMIREAKNKEGN